MLGMFRVALAALLLGLVWVLDCLEERYNYFIADGWYDLWLGLAQDLAPEYYSKHTH